MTLTGVGGGGKTRLAVAIVAEVEEVFDGAVFIPIALVSAFLTNETEVSFGDVVVALSLFGGLPLLAAFVFVNAAVAAVLREIEDGRRPSVLDSYRAV